MLFLVFTQVPGTYNKIQQSLKTHCFQNTTKLQNLSVLFALIQPTNHEISNSRESEV